MTKKSTVLIVLFLFVFLFFVGCDKGNTAEKTSENLNGTWIVSSDYFPEQLPYTVSFYKSGMGTKDGVSFSYEISGSNIYIYSGDGNETWSFSVSDNELTIGILSETVVYEKSK